MGGKNQVKNLALVGLGPRSKSAAGNSADLEVSNANRLGKMIASIVSDLKSESIAIAFPFAINNAGITQCLLGLHDGAYVDNRYKKLPEGGHKPFPLKKLTFIGVSSEVASDVAVTASLTNMIASGVTLARDLVGSYL